LASSDEIKKQSVLVQKAKVSVLPIFTEARLLESVSASGVQTPNLASPTKNRSGRLSESGNTLIVNQSFYSSLQSLEETDGTAPTITLLLPDNGAQKTNNANDTVFSKFVPRSNFFFAIGPNTGDFKVAVFGLGFAAGPGFKIRFGTHILSLEFFKCQFLKSDIISRFCVH
jgi:hypothetical protein